MKSWFAILGVSLGLTLAAPAYAEPGVDEPATDENNGSFLADLNKVGIGFSDPAQAVSAGQAVCGCLHNGMGGLHLIQHLQESNPALTESGAAQFATISAKAYCPKQLEEEHAPGHKYLKGNAPGKGTGDGETTVPKGGGGGGGGVD
jgi:predicted lipoprotein with Yx(FWY)xxD motif